MIFVVEKQLFFGWIWQEWGNTAWEDMARFGSIG